MSADRTIYTLHELAQSIQKSIADKFISAYWIKAEMNKLNHYSQSGHCFPELLEKQDGKVIAQMRSTLWRGDYNRINEHFINTLGQALQDGIKILFLARVSFDPVYGLTLRIIDIDAAYTLGDIEREKQETIRALQQEGIFNQNKLLPLPLLPQRLAIISVESSKGLADFREIIDKNPFGYRFFTMLFPSLLQGDKAIDTLIQQLNRIRKVSSHFDAVAIIRGGGDDIGLSCFNNYRLTKAIATFPLPVLSGIGHSTNETVTEMVTHYNAITPTKLAEYLLQKFHEFAVPVQEAEKLIQRTPAQILLQGRQEVQRASLMVSRSTQQALLMIRQQLQEKTQIIKREVHHQGSRSRYMMAHAKGRLATATTRHQEALARKLDQVKARLVSAPEYALQRQSEEVEAFQKMVKALDPVHVLKRGYSITMVNGKSITDASGVKKGDRMFTRLYNGSISSTAEDSKGEGANWRGGDFDL